MTSVAGAMHSPQGDGEQIWVLGCLATIIVPGEAVDERFALIEFLAPRHLSPPLHTHPQDETFIMLDGRLTFQAAGEQRFVAELARPSSYRPRFATPGVSIARQRACSSSAHRPVSTACFATLACQL